MSAEVNDYSSGLTPVERRAIENDVAANVGPSAIHAAFERGMRLVDLGRLTIGELSHQLTSTTEGSALNELYTEESFATL